ncbi:MAG: sfsA [Clostridia bacterium]|nr:sfsA [Clostridia bacterium]
MKLDYDIYYGTFICRPNRFIAHIEKEGEEVISHIPNTGRLKELLYPGAEVIVSYHSSPHRKTKYELRMVKKGSNWVSIDSQLPNALAAEAISSGIIEELQNYPILKREIFYGRSRFDIQLIGATSCFVEVKGVTLEKDGWSYFPDAPTERGRKHIDELIKVVKSGSRAVLLFVIQCNNVKGFSPNPSMDLAFAQKVKAAASAGVEIFAYSCHVSPLEVKITHKIPVKID